MNQSFARRHLTLVATLALSAMAATPVVMGATRALATADDPIATATLRVEPVEVAAVSPAPVPACQHKVRVVYGSYGTPEGCAAR
ncbi:hypothetical protein [Methylobacterium persicinum]|uniref:Porin n=1 Tax=Methylobacterium persicinum TaxID=374426 RepID=A0ABU0HMM1_9HYPH|nr:hypothetical protein [Methylobacterium persicinum]MDQ0443582.1 hypothetical protein [Methylobacterium persicinum]GJE36839.1 hypothetical protein KHHGKMAE_0893 [Methylobacterium persicinum]